MSKKKPRNEAKTTPDQIAEELEAIMYYIGKRAKNNPKLKGLATMPTSIITDNEVIFEDVPAIKTRKVPSEQVHLIIAPNVSKDKQESVRIDLLSKFSGALSRAQLEAYETIKNMLFGILSTEEKEDFLSEYREVIKSIRNT